MDKQKWYEKIDWQPFIWFGCFMVLVLTAYFGTENEIVKGLLNMGAGAVAPRIRSSKPAEKPGE